MNAKRLFVSLLLVATAATAQMNRREGSHPPMDSALPLPAVFSVTGVVSSVSGATISIANGLITVNASHAKVVGDHGQAATLGAIVPGALIVAAINDTTIAANAPLPATLIAVTNPAAVTVSGRVTAVDTVHNTLTVLGRTIQVNAQTSIGGPMHGSNITKLSDIQPNELVVVQANPSGSSLVATSIMVMAFTIDHADIVYGTVKSIATDSWVITGRNGKDVTVTVNAQTRIVGDPKVGDTVTAMVHTDSSNRLVAISIVKFVMPMMPGH